MNPDRINALFCAINTLQGNEGGFSPHEKANAIQELKRMLAEEESKKENL